MERGIGGYEPWREKGSQQLRSSANLLSALLLAREDRRGLHSDLLSPYSAAVFFPLYSMAFRRICSLILRPPLSPLPSFKHYPITLPPLVTLSSPSLPFPLRTYLSALPSSWTTTTAAAKRRGCQHRRTTSRNISSDSRHSQVLTLTLVLTLHCVCVACLPSAVRCCALRAVVVTLL
jgi:hypothetical protein